MQQPALFEEDFPIGIVNVASVPKLSLFRYPGGKTWFVPYIRHWLSPTTREQCGLSPTFQKNFVEPFLGGGSIGLTVASERLARHVIGAELDASVAAVWQTVLHPVDGEWLAQRILTYDLTVENVQTLLGEAAGTVRERAFQTIIKNRVSRGGILAPGSGLLKLGENGKGIVSRWYPATLARRIRHIVEIRDRISFLSGDGLEIIDAHKHDPHAIFFIDPPYTAGTKGKRAGQRLYVHSEVDHERLFDLVSQIQGDFLMMYDNAEEVRDLVARYGFETRLIPMRNSHHVEMKELLIGNRLDWIPRPSL